MSKTDYKKMSALHQVNWLRVVLDEGHCIRNITSNQSKACIALNSERRWFVTGMLASFLAISQPFHGQVESWETAL